VAERTESKILPFPDLIGERRRASCAVIREEIDSLPECRVDAVSQAEERVREGFYDRPEVRLEILRRLAARLVAQLGPKPEGK